VTLPRLLLVDDSQAILAYETASLSDHYAIVTAKSGREALARLAESTWDAVLLDLSMREMDGDDVLRAMKADPELLHIPVIIVSTERDRAEACMKAGAAAYLPKPIRADELRALVGRVLADARRAEQEGHVGVLFLSIAAVQNGIFLDGVRAVVLMPATRSVPVEGGGSCDLFDFHGDMVCVLDLAAALSVAHGARRVDRRVVIVESGASAVHGHGEPRVLFGLAADAVLPPDVYRPEAPRAEDVGALLTSGALLSVVATERGSVPVADPLRLFPPAFLAQLPDAARRARLESAPESTP
jgi:CheY-like chemotaxis protein